MASFNFTFLNLNKWSVLVSLYCFAMVLSRSSVSSLNDSKDLLLTLQQKEKLEKFKAQVVDFLPEKFMKSDFYLVRWLRARNFDIPNAKSMLLETLKWRRDNNITHSLSEDWSDLEQDYEQSFGGYDKDGRPVWELPMGDWDLRAASLHGTIPRLQRYLAYGTERMMREVLKAQQRNNKKPVTRATVITDVGGFNLRQHACPSCLSVLIQWTLVQEMHYPGITDQIVIFNAPPAIVIALNAVRPIMSADTRSQLKVIGYNKNEWMPYLDKIIDRNQRTSRFGGRRQL